MGVILFLAAVATVGAGVVRLGAALDAEGHNSPAVRQSLVLLALAGAGLGAGVSIVIWEVSARLSDK